MAGSFQLSRRQSLTLAAGFLGEVACRAFSPRHAVAADAPAPAAGTAPSSQKQIIVGLSQEPTVFHPLLPHIEVDDGVLMNLFSPLWRINARGDFIPDLVTAIPSLENGDISPDGRTWRIRLRTDALWHDGQPVTAEDVLFTLQTLRDPSFPAYTRSGFDLIDHIEKTGSSELSWHMREPYAPFHAVLASAMIVPSHLLKNRSDTSAFSRAPVGSGPFLWGERIPSEEIRLKANPHYHLPKAEIEEAIIRYIPDLTVMFTQFETGEIDYLGMQGILPDRYPQARTLEKRTIIQAPQPFVEGLAFNMGRPYFQDLAVRQAIYEAIDKETMLKTLFQGIEISTESFLPAESPFFNPDLPAHRFDPDAAAEKLEQAGWRKNHDGVRSRNGIRLEFTNATTSSNALRTQAQEIIQQYLADIGIIMRIEDRPAAVMWGHYWVNSEFDSALVSVDYMTGSDPDASSFFTSTASPAKGGRGQNVFQYANPAVDRLFQEGNRTFDRAARIQCYRQIQKILREDLPMLPFYQVNNIEGVKDDLAGYESNVNVRSNLWNLPQWHWT
ncbi:peptide ABC transporter substrate-binding protein [Gluconobacter sp. R75690]|uniref:peptide ABC transporter substrate-binding protein n=1 Tax=Gluconobacter TaxID=441 RepID=UPI00188BA4D4|nr:MULTISPECIES: peptide ABC transporter substrate-binding protein [unclassified Gluconobacter]MBF0851196.1 peptide ABC transporter substrate-binding protein [Gluconobacter sp. R75690]MBF0880037.1 peptide ABC transporter substrate-binding protein [Gluconobacter sp. R75828]